MKIIEIIILILYILAGLGLVISAWTESKEVLNLKERLILSAVTLIAWPIEIIIGYIITKKDNKTWEKDKKQIES